MRTPTPYPDEDVDYHVQGYANSRWTSRVVGHIAAQVNEWLAANPGFEGEILADWRDGSEQLDVTDIFPREAVEQQSISGEAA